MHASTILPTLLLVSNLVGCGDKFDGNGTGPGGTSDGGATDAGTTDAGTTDAGTTDAGTTDAGATDAGATDAGGTDAGTTDGGGSGGNVWDEVNPDNCTDLPDFEGVSGAASYFIGEYSPAGGPTGGTETWALYANPVWEAAGGADCVVVWEMSAVSTAVGSCGSCDYGLDVTGNIDLSATTCPKPLYSGQESWTTSYDVDEQDDGSADWYYGATGTVVGSGYVGAGVSFITPASCVWFGGR